MAKVLVSSEWWRTSIGFYWFPGVRFWDPRDVAIDCIFFVRDPFEHTDFSPFWPKVVRYAFSPRAEADAPIWKLTLLPLLFMLSLKVRNSWSFLNLKVVCRFELLDMFCSLKELDAPRPMRFDLELLLPLMSGIVNCSDCSRKLLLAESFFRSSPNLGIFKFRRLSCFL